MRRNLFPGLTTAVILVTALGLFTGCGDEDPKTTPITSEGAESVVENTLVLVDGMVSQVPTWADGSFDDQIVTKRAGCNIDYDTLPNWDATDMAYNWAASVDCSEDANTFTAAETGWVQFLSQGTPQQSHEGATGVSARHTWSVTAHFEEDETVADANVSVQNEMMVTGLPNGPFALDGSGTMTGSQSATSPEGSFNFSIDAGWDMDLSVPASGACPTGTVMMTVGAFEVTATYNGTGTVAWDMTDGEFQGSGTAPADCSVPVKN